ncbi:hypothetical protein D9M72_344770 [compost metagenome]
MWWRRCSRRGSLSWPTATSCTTHSTTRCGWWPSRTRATTRPRPRARWTAKRPSRAAPSWCRSGAPTAPPCARARGPRCRCRCNPAAAFATCTPKGPRIRAGACSRPSPRRMPMRRACRCCRTRTTAIAARCAAPCSKACRSRCCCRRRCWCCGSSCRPPRARCAAWRATWPRRTSAARPSCRWRACPTRSRRWWAPSTTCCRACAAPSPRSGASCRTRRTSCARRWPPSACRSRTCARTCRPAKPPSASTSSRPA